MYSRCLGHSCKVLRFYNTDRNAENNLCRWFNIHTYPVRCEINFLSSNKTLSDGVLCFFSFFSKLFSHLGLPSKFNCHLAIGVLSHPHSSSSTEVWMTPCRPPEASPAVVGVLSLPLSLVAPLCCGVPLGVCLGPSRIHDSRALGSNSFSAWCHFVVAH